MGSIRERRIRKFAPRREKFYNKLFVRKNLILVGVALITAIILSPNIYRKKINYKVGDIATEDIKAPYDLTIPDREATQKKIQEELSKALPIFDYDPTQGTQVVNKITKAFSSIKDQNLKSRQFLKELADNLGVKIPPETSKYIQNDNDLLQFELKLKKLVSEAYRRMIVEDKKRLLSTYPNGIIVRRLNTGGEREIETRLTPERIKNLISLTDASHFLKKLADQLFPETPARERKILADISAQLISPNLTLNKQATNEEIQKLRENVKEVFYKVKKGEVIVREGEKINREQLVIISYFNKRGNKLRIWLSFLGIFLIDLILLITLYTFYKIIRKNRTPVTEKDLLFLASIIILSMIGLKAGEIIASAIHDGFSSLYTEAMIFAIPLAAAAMIVRLTLGSLIAFLILIFLSFNSGILFRNNLIMLGYFFVTGLAGIYGTNIYNSRKEIMKTGFKIGGLATLYAAITFFLKPDPLYLGESIFFAFSSGILSAIMTLGFVPLFEYIFGYVTQLTLLELANIEHPLLKEMLFKAQGSYHHSLIVGNLAEVAAEAIGANPLLAKVQAYFHDVGKILKPEYFVENQTGGVNPHDNLNPYMSAKIIVSHVKDGVILAKQYKLPQVIIDAIQQHHGTSLMKYFYSKAKEMADDPDKVSESDFRYPGPKPQTKEIGIIMMADAVEAASRTLIDPQPGRVQYLIDKIVGGIIEDGQLDETDLTFKDIKKIKESFLRVLSGAFHHRIDYPGVELNKPLKAAENGKNGNSKQSETVQNPGKKNK